jgi:hypothetical protein
MAGKETGQGGGGDARPCRYRGRIIIRIISCTGKRRCGAVMVLLDLGLVRRDSGRPWHFVVRGE